jgi:hypothetical protein
MRRPLAASTLLMIVLGAFGYYVWDRFTTYLKLRLLAFTAGTRTWPK